MKTFTQRLDEFEHLMNMLGHDGAKRRSELDAAMADLDRTITEEIRNLPGEGK